MHHIHRFMVNMVVMCVYRVMYLIVIISRNNMIHIIAIISTYYDVYNNKSIKCNSMHDKYCYMDNYSVMNLFVHFSQRRSPVHQLGNPFLPQEVQGV